MTLQTHSRWKCLPRLPTACRWLGLACGLLLLFVSGATAADIKQSPLYQRLKAGLDEVRVIDTHDHLRPFASMNSLDLTDQGTGMTLHGIWAGSYYPGINPLSAWPAGGDFATWWRTAEHDFDNARATSFYRSMLPAFRDLYEVDFETLTPEGAADLNGRIFANYRDDRWLNHVIRDRAKIDLMFVDPYWARFKFEQAYPFAVGVLNVTSLVRGTHPDSYTNPWDSLYEFAKNRGQPITSLDDYLVMLDQLFSEAAAHDVACLKSTLAYERTLEFRPVSREQAEPSFGRRHEELSAEERRNFEDFIFWRLVELAAAHQLPFQIHTGQARLQGSNPMLLADLIEANPRTRFVLFHGGFPWVGETGALAMRFKNVWIDSVWLPTLSYSMARRAYQEWMEVMPSERIMWGADGTSAEGIYAATEFTRQCLGEALAEKVERGELREEHAERIGRQVLRENALSLFPRLERRLGKTAAVR